MITVLYTRLGEETRISLLEGAKKFFPLPECEDYITALEKKGNENGARESLAALALLGRAAEWMSIDTGKLCLAKTEKGKPYFDGSDISFSITHSHGYVAVALSDDGEVGIDLETSEYDSKKARRIAERYFTEDEKKELDQAKGKISQRFARIWTKKEAYVKLMGITLAEQIAKRDESSRVFYRYFDIDGHPLTVCTHQDEENLTFGKEKL